MKSKTQPKILAGNYYDNEQLHRVVIHFARSSGINLEYLLACYQMWYPFFEYKEHAEEGFETLISTALAEGNVTPLAQIVGIIIADIDSFKEHRSFK